MFYKDGKLICKKTGNSLRFLKTAIFKIMSNFTRLINNLDLKLFEKIESQSNDNDKQSFLACQSAVRSLTTAYNYLEIGSYLGGSIQPYLLDDKCGVIYSIDKRPAVQPDERGIDYIYLNNSTERMLEHLRSVAPTDKIKTIDGDTRHDVKPAQITDEIQLCLIDGEHTDGAVYSDFKFCLNILRENGGAIIFHDAQITYNGIADCIEYLQKNSIEFRAYNLPDVVFVIEIGDFPLHRSQPITERLINNYQGYLFSMKFNDYYRRFANKKPFLIYRKVITKLKGMNISN